MTDLRQRLVTTEAEYVAAREQAHEGLMHSNEEYLSRFYGPDEVRSIVRHTEACAAYYAVLREIAQLATDAGLAVGLPMHMMDEFEGVERKKAA